jgi:tRNA nucleotidyltransferase (CCA-adding enzyme)
VPVRFRIEDSALAGPLRQIEQLIRRAGGRTWLVGGCIRDLVLGRQPRDLDLEVSGLPPGQLHALLTEHFSVQFVGKAFGVFKLQGLPIDISIPSRMLTDNESAQGLLRQSDPDMDIDWNSVTPSMAEPTSMRMCCAMCRNVSPKTRCACCAACN